MSSLRNCNSVGRHFPQRLPTIAKFNFCLEASTAHYTPCIIWISAFGTAPGEPRVRTKQSARNRHQHIRWFKRGILVGLLRELPAEYLLPVAAVRALRVRRQPDRHSQSRQYQHRHPICREKQHPHRHNGMEPDYFPDPTSLGS